jgi:catechol 2,3-dioxygenase-like lactoylglutathione lyase family enzyme
VVLEATPGSDFQGALTPVKVLRVDCGEPAESSAPPPHPLIPGSSSNYRYSIHNGGRPVLSDHPVFPILLSRDLDASRHFYHGVLGLPILREDLPDRIVFGSGGGTQLVVTASTTGTKDIQTQLAWRVPDVRAAVDDLRARAVRIEEYRSPDPVTHDGIADMGHSWAAWFIDPSENILAVVEPKK